METDRQRSKRTRRPNGASSIYKGKDGKWHGRVTVGVRDDGKPDRRHVERKTEVEVIKAVRELERERDKGTVTKAGQTWTVETWMTCWLEHIAPAKAGDNALDAYETAIRVHIIPGIGAHKLKKLEPEHLERLYAKMQANGSAAGTAHQAHRTLRTALGAAFKRGHIGRNVASLAEPPKVNEEEVEPYTMEEVKMLLKAAEGRRNGARWAVALALGLRQGEVLGLRWSDVDLEKKELRIRQSRLRPKWVHGCKGGKCGQQAGFCPQRKNVRKTTKAPKSKAGRRRVGLPDQLVTVLRHHREEQERERERAGNLWVDEGWVFAKMNGEAVVPNTDYKNWLRLLEAAGVQRKRLHDARHTAATVLLILGVPERTVMGLMGWSSTSMTKRYQHLTDDIRQGVAKRIGELVWGDEEPTEDDQNPK